MAEKIKEEEKELTYLETGVLELSKTYVFNDKEYKELDLNIENLTGADLLKIERMYKTRLKKNEIEFLKENNTVFLVSVASEITGIKYSDLLTLKAKDFGKMCVVLKSFLLSD